MSDGFTLGGLVFDNWETPPEIALPSGHKVNIHKLVGGQRQVDAMGADPEPLSWTGRARGQRASGDMQAVKAMCDSGATVSLTWNEFSYQVIITKFEPKYKKPIEWTYSITVEIVSDPSAGGVGSGASSLDALVGGDIATIMSLIF